VGRSKTWGGCKKDEIQTKLESTEADLRKRIQWLWNISFLRIGEGGREVTEGKGKPF